MIVRRGVEYYTISEMAKKLGVHRNTVVYWVTTQQVSAVRSGMAPKSPWLIPVQEMERVLKAIPESE